MPEMSALMWHSTDCSNTGITFRFQPLVAYSCQGKYLWEGDEGYDKDLRSLAQGMLILRSQTFLKHLRNSIGILLQVRSPCSEPKCTLPWMQGLGPHFFLHMQSYSLSFL